MLMLILLEAEDQSITQESKSGSGRQFNFIKLFSLWQMLLASSHSSNQITGREADKDDGTLVLRDS